MQRLSPLLKAALLLLVGSVRAAWAGEGDQVYHLTKHGSADAGVQRTSAAPRGHCGQCHAVRAAAPPAPLLFTTNDNGLCGTCHAAAAGAYLGAAVYGGAAHATAPAARWPGPVPPARDGGVAGLCLNCHTPHGTRDARGLVPSLGILREEALCLTCHDGSGPARANVAAEVTKASGHPTATVADVHRASEPLTGASFGASARHAECVDCHDPHVATGSPPAYQGASSVAVTNGAAGSAPSFAPLAPGVGRPLREYELCFKCHSSWTQQPAGKPDLALVLNPANESFHPIEGPGRSTSTQLSASLAAGTGLPHLTTASTVTCSDCHGSEALPTTVSTVASYAGAIPTGPHGSQVPSLLRAGYRQTLKPRAASNDYTAADFALCFICHSPAPFGTSSENTRADTAFRFHGLHLNRIFDKGSLAGDLNTPGAGRGNAICRECHYNTHGTRGAAHSSNATYARGVNFAPNVQGAGGTGQPAWSSQNRTCTLRCHGQGHSNESY